MGNQVTGTRDTANIEQKKIIVDMSERISLLEPNETMFFAFLKFAQKDKQKANSYKIEWLEDDLLARWDAINNAAGYANNITSIVVDNGDYFSPLDIVKVPRTGEVMLVTGVNTNTLTVTRGFGVTAAAALVDNDPLVIIGNVNEEGSGTRIIKSTKEVPKYNYTQIWKTPFGVTNTQKATKMYGGSDLSYQQMKAGKMHKIDIERSLLLGERKEDTTGGAPKRSTGGLLSFLTKNNYDAGGATTRSEFDNNISEAVFKYGSKDKLLLSSSRLLSVINEWAMGKLQINQDARKFGLKIFEYETPHGTFHIMNCSTVLEGAVYGGYGIVVDPANVRYRPLRDTELETNIQANDADKRMDQYITEAALEVRQPDTHAVITGVTS
ncbi:SU10 major capsid protein [Gorillibacterium sp. sgz5001074]|uniref:SU10 major capsid protein n=1 Tax=Gorillibacterium sp. sgz5001074 TaxID=3446695 RepID=UPI003F664613